MAGGVLGAVPSVLVDAGALAGVLVALSAAAKVPVVRRPVRWVVRRLVVEPMTAWHRQVTTEVVREHVEPIEARLAGVEHEMRPNGGESLRDRVDHIAHQVSEVRRNAGL